MQLILPIAIKPFVKKFIGYECAVEPFVLSTANIYGIFLYQCLSKPDERVLRLVDENPVDLSRFTDVLLVKIPEVKYNMKGCLFTPESVVHFNKFVTYNFNKEFYNYVHNRIGAKGSINRAIMNFRDIYDLSEDELAFRTIQRAFQRRNANVKRSMSA